MGGTLAVMLVVSGSAAQTLTLQEQPSAVSLVCPPPTTAPVCSTGNEAEVEQLINAATQATILGDLTQAGELLTHALELNPCVAEATYLQGRLVARTQGPVEATEWFCRYLELAPSGSSAQEAQRQLDQAVEAGAAEEILADFSEAVAYYQEGDMARAGIAFTAVLDQRPVPEAYYNRALVRLAQGNPSPAYLDLERYLELRPDGAEGEVIAPALEDRRDWIPKSPTAAFFLGAFLPGAGQYYTGRPLFGATVTSLVAGVVAGGYFFERTTLLCRAPDASGSCPPSAVAGQETERPLLVPALAVGAGFMIASAIEAAVNAGGRDLPLTVAFGGASGPRLEVAAGAYPSRGALDVHLLRFLH